MGEHSEDKPNSRAIVAALAAIAALFLFGAGSAAAQEQEQWEPLGLDANGQQNPGLATSFGIRPIEISGDGERVVVGVRLNGGGNGVARAYELTPTGWVQLGATLIGANSGDAFGESVAIDDDGSHILVGAPRRNFDALSAAYARVYAYSAADDAWVQVGADITSATLGETVGDSVAISRDGTRVAVGAPFAGGFTAGGQVRVYEYDGTDWVQVGASMGANGEYDLFGKRVRLNADGSRVMASAMQSGPNLSGPGYAKVLAFSGGAWQQVGADLTMFTIDMNDSGTRVVGSPQYGGGAGVYEEVAGAWVLDDVPYPTPAGKNPSFGRDGDRLARTVGSIEMEAGAAAVYDRRIIFDCAANAGVLTWTDNQQGLYWVYKSTDGGATFDWIGRTLGATTLTDSSPAGGTQYQVHYQGVPCEDCTITAEPPAVPIFSCASDAGVLTWPDNQQNKYWVYKSTDGGASFNWIGRTLGATTFTDPAPSVGAQYQVHYQGIPRFDCDIVSEPTVVAFACEASGAVLTWTDDAQSKYWVYRSTDGGQTYNWIGRTFGATAFTDPAPFAGALYQVHYAGIPRVNCTVS